MATLEELHQGLIKADAAGNTADAKAFADAIRAMQQPKYDPTEGMSGYEKAMAGAGKAVSDVGFGIRQLGARAMDAISPREQGLTSLVVGRRPTRVEELQKEAADRRELDAPLMNTGAGLAGNIGGQVAMALLPGGVLKAGGSALQAVPAAAKAGAALSTAGRVLMTPQSLTQAAAVGGLQGAMAPSVSDTEGLANIGLGAGAGAAGAAVGRLLSPNTTKEVRLLMDEGVNPTVGQILGGGFQRAEDKLMSVPILGDAITGARRGAVEDLNRAMYNRALSGIGQKSAAKVGREGVADVSAKLGAAYDDVLPKVQFSPDQQYLQDLARVLTKGAQELPEAQAKQLDTIASSQLFGKLGSPVTGTELKPVQSELSRLARGMRGDPSFDVRNLGQAVTDLNQATRDASMRATADPAALQALRAVDQGYGPYAIVRDAAGRTGSKEGVFSPEALQAAVRASDKSVGKGNFARGAANMQDLSDAAVTVLGRGYPDSGTAGRLLMGGGGLGGAAAYGIPGAMEAGVGLGLASTPYLPYARQLAAQLLAGSRPVAVQNMAPYVRGLAIGSAPTLPALVNAQQQ